MASLLSLTVRSERHGDGRVEEGFHAVNEALKERAETMAVSEVDEDGTVVEP